MKPNPSVLAPAAIALWLMLLSFPTAVPADTPAQARSDTSVTVCNFALLDHKGRYHELHKAGGRAVVLFFVDNSCPIVRQSISKMKRIRRSFERDGTTVWLVNSSLDDDLESIEKEASKLEIGSLPILRDESQGVARMLGVKRTAEVIAISTKDWTIFYRGAVDDQLTEGAKKPQPTMKYLEVALQDFLAGRPVNQKQSPVHGCLITFDLQLEQGTSEISYSRGIAPLLQTKCVGCHSAGNIGPFAMSSYERIKNRRDMIQEVLLAQRMPPWHADPHYGKFENDRSLTLHEKRRLLRWIEEGAPPGDGPDALAKPVAPTEDWPLGQPDIVLKLPSPESVPPTGVVDYRHIQVNNPLTNDVWVRAVVPRPQNKKVVHHIIVRLKYPEGKNPMDREDAFLTAWAPGSSLGSFPEGTAKFVGKEAGFDFEMHYTTVGTAETDQSEVGLYLAKEAPKMVFETRAPVNFDFSIPPEEENSVTFAVYGLKKPTIIFDLAPHMHLRGSWFKYEALYPDGERELLLSVPHYDFNWQTTYRLAKPKRVPPGTWILCTGGFDNSERNPHNPDPSKRVKWGDQSFDEMFIGFMNVTEPPGDTKVAIGTQNR